MTQPLWQNSGPVFGDGLAGGGCWTIAALQAGRSPAWAIEYDPAIAAVHESNLPGQMIVSRIQDVNPLSLDLAEIAAFSTVCKEFSVANSGGQEGLEEITQAEAVCRIIRCHKPKAILIENVMKYRKSRSVEIIRRCLTECGYWWDEHIVNSADFGVPQTRKRWILRACRGPLPPMPSPVAWTGWYSAIVDLIPMLPASQFAPWQLARLPQQLQESAVFGVNESYDHKGNGSGRVAHRTAEEPALTVTADHQIRTKAFLQMTGNTQLACPSGTGMLWEEEPANTVCANSTRNARAFLVDGQTAGRDKGRPRALLVDSINSGPLARPNPRRGEQPSMTITTTQVPKAWLVGDQYGSANTEPERRLCLRSEEQPSLTVMASERGGNFRAWLEQGRVVSMTPRALARFQTIPDWYDFTGSTVSLSCTIIGNAIPVLMARRLIEGMLEAIS